MDHLIIVDCQYDFIDGSLACAHSHEAVSNLVNYINTHEVDVIYTSDWHGETNQSFLVNGGIWPVHCVAGTKGAALSAVFEQIHRESERPNKKNIFLKGKSDEIEEYSAYLAMNEAGTVLKDIVSSHVIVGGIASEYCVRETILSLLKAGHIVSLLSDCVGYVSLEEHKKNIEDLKKRGVEIL